MEEIQEQPKPEVKVYKLSYPSKEEGVADLTSKGIYDNPLTHAIVEIPSKVLQEATYDSEGIELTPAIYSTAYNVDIMSEEVYEFGENGVQPTTPDHSFSGWEIINPIIENNE